MHFKKNSLLPRILGVLALLLLARPDEVQARRIRRPPESGVPDAFVVSLGTAAQTHLLSKLGDPREEKHYMGLIRQLGNMERSNSMNQDLTEGLIRFITTQTIRKGEIPFGTIKTMMDALRIIGYSGGERGVQYLANWITSNKLADAVTCHIARADNSFTIFELRKAAIQGLGLSGRDDAARALGAARSAMSSDPKYSALAEEVDRALQDHAAVKQKGLKTILKEQNLR